MLGASVMALSLTVNGEDRGSAVAAFGSVSWRSSNALRARGERALSPVDQSTRGRPFLEGSLDAESLNHNRHTCAAHRVWRIDSTGSPNGAGGGAAGQRPTADGSGRGGPELRQLARPAHCESYVAR